MREKEARTIRYNGAKLYQRVRDTHYATVRYFVVDVLNEPEESVGPAAEALWSAYHLDDVFHELNSYGFRQLIQDGWSPYSTEDPANWTPSADCIDNPTTRGGAADD